MIRRLRDEAGYSLVEVMASILILSAAIIPMVGMFDMGLETANSGSEYDKARTLANLKLEEAKILPYAQVKNNFPESAGTPTTYNGSGYYQSTYRQPGGNLNNDFPGFEYRVEKQYLVQPPVAPTSTSQSFATNASDQGVIKVTVTAKWDSTKTFSTSGLIAQGKE